MTQNETNVFQALIKHEPHFLDRPLEELLPLRFMGEVVVNNYRGLIKRHPNLPLSLEQKKATLKDGQDAGRLLLAIEARIGELSLKEKRIPPKFPGGGGAIPSGKPPKHERLGMTEKQLYRSEMIAKHPKEVEEVFKEAEKNEDIPTKTAVLNKIAYKRELERVKSTREKTQLEMAADAYSYYTKLLEVLNILPVKPPKELREKDLIKIKALALLIIKRLEVFIDGTKTKNHYGSGRRLPA